MIQSSLLNTFGQRVAMSFTALARMLEEQETTVPLVAITMNGPFECIEMWANQSTYAMRKGYQNLNIPDDPGLSQHDAFPVYDALDKVFNETFPLLSGISREHGALYIQMLMRKVSRELIEAGQNPRGTEDYVDLQRFSRAVVAVFKTK